MPSFLWLLAISCTLSLCLASNLDPEEQVFLDSILKGRGLYYNYPHIFNLIGTNFEELVKGKNYSWVVEFYNSWCGDCLRFTPTYKRLANDLKGWTQVVKFGAVDCSNHLNTPLCRYYGVTSTPALLYFDPHLNKEEGTKIPRIKKKRDVETAETNVPKLRKDVTLELLRRKDLPELQLFRGSVEQLWNRGKPKSQFVLVVECTPEIGPQLVLDYWNVKKVTVVPVDCKSSSLLNKVQIEHSINGAVFVVNKGRPRIGVNTTIGTITRSEALTKLHKYFTTMGIEVPLAFDLSSIKDISNDLKDSFKKINTGKKPYKHTGEVFRVDIEGALSHTLKMEIPVHKHIDGKALIALYDYLHILIKYFPIGQHGKRFLSCVENGVRSTATKTKSIAGQKFFDIVNSCEKTNNPQYLEPDNGWVGCHGTFPIYRGFPCSMWTMFHTLTVQAYQQGAKDPKEVLSAMKGYIGNFFGCSNCAQHFLLVGRTMESEVKSLKDSVLFLWKAHNIANKRLHGDATEDPNFPKVQFPTREICKACHKANGSVDRDEVLNFLVHMYTNIENVTPTQLGFNTSYVGRRF